MQHEINKETMDSLKALADTNMKISEAKSTLYTLQKEQVEYLRNREKLTLEQVQKVLDNSKALVRETNENYEQVKTFYNTVSSYAQFLSEAHTNFDSLIGVFAEKSELWSQEIKRQEDEILTQKNRLKADHAKITDEREGIERAKVKLQEVERKLTSDRGTLERAIQRLKNNRI